MKAKQREASYSALHMGQGSCVSDDSPHRSAYLPKLLSSRRIDQDAIRKAPLSDDEDLRETLKNPSQPLNRSSSLMLEPDETTEQEVELLEDYELPLKGGKRSKKKSKRRKDSKKKKHHGKSGKDNVHFDLHLEDCGVQTPMSEVSMDEWFEDMYEAQLSHSSLLGNLPTEDDLTAAFLDAGVHIAEHKSKSLVELKEEVRESEKAASTSTASLVGKKIKKKKSKAHGELEFTPPHSPQRRPCFSSPGDIQLDGRRSQFLDSTTVTSSWQNPLKKASPEGISMYESSSEWQSRQRLRSEWSDFVKCKRGSKSHPSTPTIDRGVARDSYQMAPSSDHSHRMSQRQHADEGMGRHSRRASMGNHFSGSDKKHSTPRRTASLNADKVDQPFELRLDPSEIEQRRKILQRTIKMSMRHLGSK